MSLSTSKTEPETKSSSIFYHYYDRERSRDDDSGGWKRYKTCVKSDGNDIKIVKMS